MDMNREGTVEGDDLPTEQDVAAVQHVSRVLTTEPIEQTDIEQAISEGEQTQRKEMAQLAKNLVSYFDNVEAVDESAHNAARQIAAYLAQQAE